MRRRVHRGLEREGRWIFLGPKSVPGRLAWGFAQIRVYYSTIFKSQIEQLIPRGLNLLPVYLLVSVRGAA